MEAQARWGDALIEVGGADGLLYLADLYLASCKPAVPLNAAVSPANTGARRLFFDIGLSSMYAPRLFRAVDRSVQKFLTVPLS